MGVSTLMDGSKETSLGLSNFILDGVILKMHLSLTEFHQPLQVQSHLEMPGILVQLGHIQRT